ncbi:MAG: thioredoxin domain-containing protein [Anaerolineae bacterium]
MNNRESKRDAPRHTNRLISESSPYLLQHAHNPVDWYPWGPEALAKARQEDKPILLSIGYSACHWCHQMEKESFENEAIARIMNEHFVNIKVDREERPDLDSIYMDAVQAMTGRGGWPMTVFLTPEGEPFYGGTYYPPTPRHGMPGFPQVLEGVAAAYRERPDEVARVAKQLVDRLQSTQQLQAGDGPLTDDLLEAAYRQLRGNYDPVHGGFGPAPKFPQPMTLEFLLQHWYRTENPIALKMVEQTLRHMARGGMYDQIGGGFHRYSVDAQWLVPHFEKMLYDNALLARVYLHAYQAVGDPIYRRIVVETLDYIRREMTDVAGGFYSAQDADSEGEEGKFFVWTPAEIRGVLGEADAKIVMDCYGVTQQGNFEGKNILHRPRDADVVAYRHAISEAELGEIVERSRRKLFETRTKRVPPTTDTKVLTSWSSLMITTFAEAARILHRDDYLQAAIDAAEFLLSTLRRDDGRLLHTYRQGRAKQLGFLEDYAFLADALLALYETTFELRWLRTAVELADDMIKLFWDDENGGLFTTGTDQEQLVARPKDLIESATPSGNAVAAHVLQRLALLTARPDYQRRAVEILRLVRDILEQYPSAMGRMLEALDFYLAQPPEIAIAGEAGTEDTAALMEVVHSRYLPNKVVALRTPEAGNEIETLIPLLEAKTMLDGQATAYVCRNYACRQPVTTPETLAEELGRVQL